MKQNGIFFFYHGAVYTNFFINLICIFGFSRAKDSKVTLVNASPLSLFTVTELSMMQMVTRFVKRRPQSAICPPEVHSLCFTLTLKLFQNQHFLVK